jgi:hypothetical protein
MIRRLLLAVAAAVAAFETAAAQPADPGLLAERIAVADSDEYAAAPPRSLRGVTAPLLAYRLYDAPAALEFVFEATNDSPNPIVVDQRRLRDGISLVFSDDARQLPVIVQWVNEVLEFGLDNPTATSEGLPIGIQAREMAQWRFTVSRADGQPFEFGNYIVKLRVDVKDAVRGADGGEWRGRHTAQGEGHIVISIQPPISTAERVSRQALIASRAHRLHDINAELAAWTRAAAEDPGNRSLDSKIALLYLVMGRYPEAARAWEAIAARVGYRSEVADSLATAYLGIGDEARARQVLRQSGKDEASLTASVGELRKRLHGRVP